jgi:hypothetical protein
MFSKRNVSNNLRLAILLVLSAGIILSFAPGALANGAIETWSGPLTVQVKATELIAGKFTTKSKSHTGLLELYMGANTLIPTPNNDGDYMKFDDGQLMTMRIKQLVWIDDEVNATTRKFLAAGVGDLYDPLAPGDPNGIVYFDLSGSWKAAAGKKLETISLVIKMGGGIDVDAIFSANPKVNLYKQPQPVE